MDTLINKESNMYCAIEASDHTWVMTLEVKATKYTKNDK